MTAQPESAGLFTVHRFEDLYLGQSESLMRTVMERDIALFAELSGDANPIHLSDAYAAGTKFGQRIAHGMLTASLVSALLGTRLPATWWWPASRSPSSWPSGAGRASSASAWLTESPCWRARPGLPCRRRVPPERSRA